MGIKNRTSFEEYDPEKIANVKYLIYEESPLCTDFVYGAEKSIVLRNEQTGKLERIRYKLHGADRSLRTNQYLSYWGRVIPECGMELVFHFDGYGKITDVRAVYSAPELTIEKLNERISNVSLRYPAEIDKYF